MSLIERAVEKLDLDRPLTFAPPRVAASAPRSRADQLVEDAIERLKLEDELWSGEASSISVEEERAVEPPPEPSAKPVKHSRKVEIDLEWLRARGMITPEASKTALAEEFRMIKRPLIRNAFGQGTAPVKNGNLIMVTSAFPREGKTFCAVNLAMSIAMEMDHTVLLVDADVARPCVPQQLGLSFDAGMMDVLVDPSVEMADVMVRTNIEKLSILPAGRTHAHSTELLASEAMSVLLNQLSTRYPDRIVIFDSPPLLLTTEARTLAAKMGQIVMVVAAETTTYTGVQEALSAIESCEVVGLVLNKAKYSQSGEYGYYGY